MKSRNSRAFDAEAFLDSAGIAKKLATFRRAQTIFSQGDVCDSVMYIQKGGVKLSVRSKTGREAIVAMLGPGDFFGEGALAGQPLRMGDATALTLSTIFVLKKKTMLRLLHKKRELADRFIAHMLGHEHPYRGRPARPAVQSTTRSGSRGRFCCSPATG